MNRNDQRAVIFQVPRLKADFENALTDALVSLEPGMLLVYARSARPRREIMSVAECVATRLNCNLVQWPCGPVSEENRAWCYAIEKPRKA